jgi:hypothetical protein
LKVCKEADFTYMYNPSIHVQELSKALKATNLSFILTAKVVGADAQHTNSDPLVLRCDNRQMHRAIQTEMTSRKQNGFIYIPNYFISILNVSLIFIIII